MTKKIGRPKSSNPKSTQLAVRLNTDEIKKLDEIANVYKISRVEVLRKGIVTLHSLLKQKQKEKEN